VTILGEKRLDNVHRRTINGSKVSPTKRKKGGGKNRNVTRGKNFGKGETKGVKIKNRKKSAKTRFATRSAKVVT